MGGYVSGHIHINIEVVLRESCGVLCLCGVVVLCCVGSVVVVLW